MISSDFHAQLQWTHCLHVTQALSSIQHLNYSSFFFSSFSFCHSRANGSQTWERLRITRRWLAPTPEFCFSGSEVSQSVQSLSRVWLFATAWTTTCQASLSITSSRSLPKLMFIESVWGLWTCILCMFLSGPDAVALGTTLWKPFYIPMETSLVFTRFPLNYPTIIFASSSMSD